MENVNEELDLFKRLAKGIASEFGDQCEVVLHDLSNPAEYNHTIVYIENGHITNRQKGDCGTNLGLEVLSSSSQGDKYNYFSQTKDGKILRSTSIYIRNKEGKVIGSLCINFNLTSFIMAEKAIQQITNGYMSTATQESEIFPRNVEDLLDALLKQSISFVGKPVAMMNKDDKIKGLAYLDEKGAFLIMKSSDKVAAFYGISKYTIYSYLDEIRKRDKV
jgi:predicted transcriptional regulator YheO